jgi:hypothetical protein
VLCCSNTLYPDHKINEDTGVAMSNSAALPALIVTSVDYHKAAADRHEEAAEAHRQAASSYMYGDFQQANAHARLARAYGTQALEQCSLAME